MEFFFSHGISRMKYCLAGVPARILSIKKSVNIRVNPWLTKYRRSIVWPKYYSAKLYFANGSRERKRPVQPSTRRLRSGLPLVTRNFKAGGVL
jgi:hypothetical protein